MNKLQRVLTYLVRNYRGRRPLNRTKLVKFTYLADLIYARAHNGKTLTGLDYQYYFYGPYSPEIPKALHELDGVVIAELTDYGPSGKEYLYLSLPDSDSHCNLPDTEKAILDHVLDEYGDMTLNRLLDFVYTKTEPMQMAKPGDKNIIKRAVARA